MRYNQLLTQLNEVAWEKSVAELISLGGIPLTRKMWKRHFEIKTIDDAFHITNDKGLSKLIEIEGTAKEISAFTTWDEDVIPIDGIQTGGEILIQLEGEPIVSSDTDIMSFPDKQGRRWILSKNTATIDAFSYKIADKITDLIEDLQEKLMKKYLKKYPDTSDLYELFGVDIQRSLRKITPTVFAKLAAGFTSGPEHINPSQKKERDRISYEYIKDYIDGTEKIITRNLPLFKSLREKLYNNKSKERHASNISTAWNEVVLAKTKIKKIYLLGYTLGYSSTPIDTYTKKYNIYVLDDNIFEFGRLKNAITFDEWRKLNPIKEQ